MKIHYSGGLQVTTLSGTKLMLPGWAVCCTGERAYKIRSGGNYADDKTKVDCKACLKLIERGEPYGG